MKITLAKRSGRFLIVLSIVSTALIAQTPGRIKGYIADDHGARIKGAEVTALPAQMEILFCTNTTAARSIIVGVKGWEFR